MARARKDKMAPELPPSWGLKIHVDQCTEVTREATEDEWDADDLQHTTSIVSVEPCGESHADVVVDFEPRPGESAWLVKVVYSTGDSFHHESGLMTVVAAFSTERLAEQALAAIESCKNESVYSIRVFSESARMQSIHCMWKGYFDSLDSASVERFEISGPKPDPKGARHGR